MPHAFQFFRTVLWATLSQLLDRLMDWHRHDLVRPGPPVGLKLDLEVEFAGGRTFAVTSRRLLKDAALEIVETPSKDDLYEGVSCRHCGRGTKVKAVWADGRPWCHPPDGWLVTDTYPPGDMGLQYACSVECAQKIDTSGE